jgi:hypothetical protein
MTWVGNVWIANKGLFEYFIHNNGFNFNQATSYIPPRLQWQILKGEFCFTKIVNIKKPIYVWRHGEAGFPLWMCQHCTPL